MTRKQEYKPQFFGILQSFSLSVWIAIISAFLMLFLLYHLTLKMRYSLDSILLHVFAVLMRQNSILRPSLITEKLLVYAWVVGAMFLCTAYESVFFSFLTVPPIIQIKDLPQLAKAVEKGEYHCVAGIRGSIYYSLLGARQEYLRILGNDLKKTNLIDSVKDVYWDLFRKSHNKNIVFMVQADIAPMYAFEEDFISDDRFLETVAAMVVPKDFCCKKLLETFVHKMLASGLYYKYLNDRAFLFKLSLLSKHSQKDTSERKITLTYVAFAFFFLLTGYLLSVLVFVGEILVYRRTKMSSFRGKAKRDVKIKVYHEDSI